MRGNVVDLAVAVVIGAAFGKVVTALVENVITPLIAIPGGADFSSVKFTVRGSEFKIYLLLNALINFVMVAAAIYFFVIVPINRLQRLRSKPSEDATTRTCPECISDIPIAASRCAFCTSPVARQA